MTEEVKQPTPAEPEKVVVNEAAIDGRTELIFTDDKAYAGGDDCVCIRLDGVQLVLEVHDVTKETLAEFCERWEEVAKVRNWPCDWDSDDIMGENLEELLED